MPLAYGYRQGPRGRPDVLAGDGTDAAVDLAVLA